MTRWRIFLLLFILGVAAIAALVWELRARQKDLNLQIDSAAQEGDFTKVAELLKRGADPNGAFTGLIHWAEDGSPKPPSFYAVSQGKVDAVRNLVESGARLQDSRLGPPLLRLALEKGNLEMFELLLKLGADPNGKCPSYDFNTLHWIVEFAQQRELAQETGVKFADLALQHGANVNYRGMNGFTPLIYALSWKQEQLVETFLNAGADYRIADDEGMNAMDVAALRADEKLISLLREHGAPYGIQEAAALGDLKAVESLLAGDRSLLDKQCYYRNSPLGVALLNGHTAVARYLMDQGASLQHLNRSGASMLHLAAQGNCAELIEPLLEKGFEVNQRDKSGDTPLHETTYSDCAEAAEVLIRHGADINAKESSAITPMQWCASYNSPKVLALLIKAGGDPNAQGAYDGAVPLDSACKYGSPKRSTECIKILVAAGADVNRKGTSGRTPLHWAASWPGGEPLVRYLLEHGADPAICDAAGKNALQIAIEEGDPGVQHLLEKRLEDAKATTSGAGQGATTPEPKPEAKPR